MGIKRRTFLGAIVGAISGLMGWPAQATVEHPASIEPVLPVAPLRRGDVVKLSLQGTMPDGTIHPETIDWYVEADVLGVVGNKVAIRSAFDELAINDGACPLPGFESDWKEHFFSVVDIDELRTNWKEHERNCMDAFNEETQVRG